MENNQFGLKVGDTAILDMGYKGFDKEVKITFMTKYCLFSDVIAVGETETYPVMTARLTPKNGKD